MSERLLKIADLDQSLVRRVRAAVSSTAIQDYAEQPDQLPPARVAEIDGRMLLVGGLHRLKAWEEAGRSEIPCIVEAMSWPEAVQTAVADNRAHGVRLSAADKRASIRLLLAEALDMSDRAIAELVGCSPSTVGTVRATLETSLHQVSNSDTCPPPATSGQVEDLLTLRPAPAVSGSAQVSKLDTSSRPAPRKGRDGKTYRPKAARAERRRPRARRPAAAPSPEPVAMPASLLVDFRTKVPSIADFLRRVLRDGHGHRSEAQDMVLAALDSDQLRRLAERATAAAAAREPAAA